MRSDFKKIKVLEEQAAVIAKLMAATEDLVRNNGCHGIEFYSKDPKHNRYVHSDHFNDAFYDRLISALHKLIEEKELELQKDVASYFEGK